MHNNHLSTLQFFLPRLQLLNYRLLLNSCSPSPGPNTSFPNSLVPPSSYIFTSEVVRAVPDEMGTTALVTATGPRRFPVRRARVPLGLLILLSEQLLLGRELLLRVGALSRSLLLDRDLRSHRPRTGLGLQREAVRRERLHLPLQLSLQTLHVLESLVHLLGLFPTALVGCLR